MGQKTDRCIARRMTVEELACHEDGEVRSVETIQIIDKAIPTEREFRRRVPIITDLGQPTTLLWYCDNFPMVRFQTAQEAAMLCECEGYKRRGRLWVEIYEFRAGSKRQPPSLEFAYETEVDPLTAEPVSALLDYAGRPIEED